MAPPKGIRSGGRQKGTLNKATIEKALIAERQALDAKTSGRKLAKEVMQDFLPILAGMAAYYQPTFPGMDQHNPNGDDAQFERWLGIMMDIADKLAPYESPTLRAIAVVPPPPELRDDPERRVIEIDDPIAVARVYRRIMMGGR